ncbi:hypothetical protein ABZP36_025948 [Zizania latifolia]
MHRCEAEEARENHCMLLCFGRLLDFLSRLWCLVGARLRLRRRLRVSWLGSAAFSVVGTRFFVRWITRLAGFIVLILGLLALALCRRLLLLRLLWPWLSLLAGFAQLRNEDVGVDIS